MDFTYMTRESLEKACQDYENEALNTKRQLHEVREFQKLIGTMPPEFKPDASNATLPERSSAYGQKWLHAFREQLRAAYKEGIVLESQFADREQFLVPLLASIWRDGYQSCAADNNGIVSGLRSQIAMIAASADKIANAYERTSAFERATAETIAGAAESIGKAIGELKVHKKARPRTTNKRGRK